MGVLGSFKSGGWAFMAGCVFPGLVMTSLASLLLLPALDEHALARSFMKQSLAEKTAVIAGASIFLGLFMSALRTSLYRALEGYSFRSESSRDRKRNRWAKKQEAVWDRYDKAKEAEASDRGFLLEECHSFPVESTDARPTRLGNVIAAFETYGWDRYRMDTVTLWPGLLASVSDDLRQTEEKARSGVDLFVNLLCLSALFAALSIATAVLAHAEYLLQGLSLAAVSLLSTVLWYRLSVAAAREWGLTVRAVVDMGRLPLASSLGLEIPDDLLGERDMWRSFGWLRKYPYDNTRPAQLEPYRAKRGSRH